MIWFDLSLLGLAVIVCFVSYRHTRTALEHLNKARALSERSSELLAQARALVDEARRLSEPKVRQPHPTIWVDGMELDAETGNATGRYEPGHPDG